MKINNNENEIKNSSFFNIPLEVEFEKWLNYIPDFEKRRKDFLYSIPIKKLSFNEFEELKLYQEQDIYSKIFENNYTEKENTLLHNYMNSHSIFELMNSKLTKNEIEFCKARINEIILNYSENELIKYLNNFTIEKYKNMNIIDAYIFHHIANFYKNNFLNKQKNKNMEKCLKYTKTRINNLS